MTMTQLQLIETLEQDLSLLQPHRLRERSDALDRLDACFPDGMENDPGDMHSRALALRARLEAANSEVCHAIRRAIQQGAGRNALWPWLRASGRDRGEGYDYRDELVSDVLQFAPPANEIAGLADEMVFYQPTPARHVVDLIQQLELGPRDVLIDLGSGLGHVPLLAAICTEARCVGVECEAVYVESARRCAEALNLANVTFIRQDARAADLSAGTVFYMYTPFTGTILRAVLDALRREAAGREIRICSYGPCTSTIASEPWLDGGVGLPATDRVAIFRSRA